MKIYELFMIFLAGAALGAIGRYILGYRKRHVGYVALNLFFGGAACAVGALCGSSDYYSLFLSGVGGVIFNFLYNAGYLIYSAI